MFGKPIAIFVFKTIGLILGVAACKPTSKGLLYEATPGNGQLLIHYANSQIQAKISGQNNSALQKPKIESVTYTVTPNSSLIPSTAFTQVAKIDFTAAKFSVVVQNTATANNGTATGMDYVSCIAEGSGIALAIKSCNKTAGAPQPTSENNSSVDSPSSPTSPDGESPPKTDLYLQASYGSQQMVEGVVYQEFWLSLETADQSAKNKIYQEIANVTFRTHPTFAKVGQDVIRVNPRGGTPKTPRLATLATSWTTGSATIEQKDGKVIEVSGVNIQWKKNSP